MKRFDPVVAAKQFIDKHFPNYQGAILAGRSIDVRPKEVAEKIKRLRLPDSDNRSKEYIISTQ